MFIVSLRKKCGYLFLVVLDKIKYSIRGHTFFSVVCHIGIEGGFNQALIKARATGAMLTIHCRSWK